MPKRNLNLIYRNRPTRVELDPEVGVPPDVPVVPEDESPLLSGPEGLRLEPLLYVLGFEADGPPKERVAR